MTDHSSPPIRKDVPPLDPGPGNRGILRRRIRLVSEGGVARGAVEDDFHHFEVRIAHDGETIRDVVGRAWRRPWDTCAGAADDAVIGRLRGVPLGTDMMRRKGLPDPLQQCTHLYEVALLTAAQGARGGSRVYDIAVPNRIGRTRFPALGDDGIIRPNPNGVDGRTVATLHRDGRPALEWTVEGETITTPGRFAGVSQRHLSRWITEHAVDDDLAEAVKVLRRGLHIAGGRVQPVARIPSAAYQGSAGIACHTFQPVNRPFAWTRLNDLLDFTHHRDALLADFPHLP